VIFKGVEMTVTVQEVRISRGADGADDIPSHSRGGGGEHASIFVKISANKDYLYLAHNGIEFETDSIIVKDISNKFKGAGIVSINYLYNILRGHYNEIAGVEKTGVINRVINQLKEGVLEKVSTLPMNWAEAKAQNPNLLTWREAKIIDRSADLPPRTVVEHLCNTETGYGMWVLNPPGLPVSFFRKGDESTYNGLYNFKGDLPQGIYVPRGEAGRKKEPAPLPSEAEVKAARRIVGRWDRHRADAEKK
jgi:hypothetical protein